MVERQYMKVINTCEKYGNSESILNNAFQETKYSCKHTVTNMESNLMEDTTLHLYNHKLMVLFVLT